MYFQLFIFIYNAKYTYMFLFKIKSYIVCGTMCYLLYFYADAVKIINKHKITKNQSTNK